jgi:MoxR-like ATPase
MFYPIFITGHSGNGKTMSVEQACAKLGRKFVLISMTPETDESDLLGNYVLINGQMVWRDGPVTVAARQGAVLCIDEIDYGAQNLASLQRVLEGKPFLLKKKNEVVTPAKGFTIVATANTKGKGSEDGRYMFTNVLNEAFLERFLNTYEQDWPDNKVEKKIINKELNSLGVKDEDFATKLVDWADIIRKTFDEGGVDEVISTRRLTHITKTYGVFKDRMKAIELCLNRFDDITKTTMLDLYTKVDPSINPVEETPQQEVAVSREEGEEIPF